MPAGTTKTGWLIALRRYGAVAAMLFGAVLVVGLSRGIAVAAAVGDEVCLFMGGDLPPRLLPSDPGDPADRSHDCCDLGLCLAAAAAPPPAAPPVPPPPAALTRLGRPRRPRRAVPPHRPVGPRPRGPPAA